MPAVNMSLPTDKPPSYEEATSLSPITSDAADELPLLPSTPDQPHTVGNLAPPLPPAVASTSSNPDQVTSVEETAKDKKEKEAMGVAKDQLSSEEMPEAMVLAKAYEAKEPPPPTGWVLDTPVPSFSELGAGAKALAKAEEASEPFTSFSSPAPAAGWSLATAVNSGFCPPGLEPLLGLDVVLLRETYTEKERGGSRRGAAVISLPLVDISPGASTGSTLLLMQRGSSRGHHRRRFLELLDGAGAQVFGLVESTRRSDVTSVEVLCPPGSRVARVETRPSPSGDMAGGVPLHHATVFNAAEQPIFKVNPPPPGEIEIQPSYQVLSVSSGGSVGTVAWRWATGADIMEAELRFPGDLDVRMKAALVTLCLLTLGAFGSRWNGGKEVTHGFKKLHVQGRRRRPH